MHTPYPNLQRVIIPLLIVLWATHGAALTAEEEQNIRAHDRVAASVVQVLVRGVAVDGKAGRQHLVRVTGSGFAVAPGQVITNYHVVEDARRIRVALHDDTLVDASIIGTAPGYDLALLKVDVDTDRLPPAPLGSSADLTVAQRVLAVSNPAGLDHSVSVGVISGLNRELPPGRQDAYVCTSQGHGREHGTKMGCIKRPSRHGIG